MLERWRFRSARAEWPTLSTFLCSERSGRKNYLKEESKTDLNKNILRITYNFLNLPKEIMFMDGSYIHYTYDAAGTLGEELTEIPGDDEEELTGFRLPDTHLMSVGDEEEEKELVEEEEEEIPYTDVIDYCGNCIYENGTLRRILVEGGYITFDSSNQPVYHFYLKDHLGNNRVVANASGQRSWTACWAWTGTTMAHGTMTGHLLCGEPWIRCARSIMASVRMCIAEIIRLMRLIRMEKLYISPKNINLLF